MTAVNPKEPSALSEAAAFLAPVFDREQLRSGKETSLVLRLSPSLSTTSDLPEARRAVIQRSLELLRNLHAQISEEQSTAPSGLRLESPNERRIVTALLDLIVLEGIYPALSPGVGIPIERRARSFTLPSLITKGSSRVEELVEPDRQLLGAIVDTLYKLLAPSSTYHSAESWSRRFKGVEGAIRERCLVDTIAASGELAFNPECPDDQRRELTASFLKFLDGISTTQLMPLLLALLPTAPLWFKAPLAQYLSLLPVTRPHGVQDILQLFLSTATSGSAQGQGPGQISTDALAKASRLISSVPSTLTAKAFFSKVCPQLLELLHSADPTLRRAAAYVIAELLGRRGAEVEEVTNTEIVEKIIRKLDPKPVVPDTGATTPPKTKTTSSALLELEHRATQATTPQPRKLVFEIPEETKRPSQQASPEPVNEGPLVSESELSGALQSLEILLSSHPTPVVSERLVSPILLQLWDLLCHAKATGRSAWHTRVSGILKSYFTTSLDVNILNKIRHNLTSLGGTGWIFASGGLGGIEIRRSPGRPGAGSETVNIKLLDNRVEEFFTLIGNDPTKSGPLTEFFLDIFRTWVARVDESEPLKMLIVVRMLQEMLGAHAGLLAQRPSELLQVIKGVLDEYIYRSENTTSTPGDITSGPPTLDSLRNMADWKASDEDEEDEDATRIETCSMALTLLSSILTSPDVNFIESDVRLLTTFPDTLKSLSKLTPDSALRSLSLNLAGMLSIHPSLTGSAPSKEPNSLTEIQRENYQTALTYLRDPLVPVRAHGLTLLRELILARAPIVDITATTRMLVTMVKDADSFVYLNVVKCLTALADRHGNTVTKMLVEAYVDDEDVLGVKGGKKGAHLQLDERLKIGEALLNIIQRLGEALVGETAVILGNAMIGIVSRRRTREEGQQKKEAEVRAKNPLPSHGDDNDEDDEEDELDEEGNPLTQQQKAELRVKENIVASWSSQPSAEDLRIRTSALSILSAAIEGSPLGMGERVMRDAVDLSVAVLTQETKLERAIIRRAAVLCVGVVLRATVGNTGEEWKTAVWNVVREKREEVARVLGWVRATDEDGLVREQAGMVVENLRAVLERGMIGGRVGV
ncbi:hypothetical protein EX30DRAFT_392699 [Ascodesmis nigricans]|uniref:RNA polymerase II assembly factor Rtp1 C-terminal domain-containing protein n=1 Tax=Ascodesmis nigricans TaxID=341454 RepID=A0A4S2N801_9PEZI|nr:hypothetical protein EX30DRAFT_392699 [Ascodesmis nigricans]